MKKFIVFLVLVALSTALISGCGTTSNAPKQATLTINTTPENATVKIDDVSVKTPVKDYPVSRGTHAIIISADGYETTSRAVTVTAPKQIVLNVTLKKLPGKVSVRINNKRKVPSCC